MPLLLGKNGEEMEIPFLGLSSLTTWTDHFWFWVVIRVVNKFVYLNSGTGFRSRSQCSFCLWFCCSRKALRSSEALCGVRFRHIHFRVFLCQHSLFILNLSLRFGNKALTKGCIECFERLSKYSGMRQKGETPKMCLFLLLSFKTILIAPSKSTFLRVDSPFLSTIVLFKSRPFPRVFDGFLKRFGSLGSDWNWKVPLELPCLLDSGGQIDPEDGGGCL